MKSLITLTLLCSFTVSAPIAQAVEIPASDANVRARDEAVRLSVARGLQVISPLAGAASTMAGYAPAGRDGERLGWTDIREPDRRDATHDRLPYPHAFSGFGFPF